MLGHDLVVTVPEDVRFVFQPLINVRIGGVLGVEALPVGGSGSLRELYRTAANDGSLAERDVSLAVEAVRAFGSFPSGLPLHINVLPTTVVRDLGRFDVLRRELRRAGRREHEVTLEIGAAEAWLDDGELLAGADYLRGCGFRIALDEVGGPGTHPTLIADVRPDLVKLDPRVVQGLPGRRGRLGVLDGMRRICESAGAGLVVCGVDDERQLGALRHQDVRLMQGTVLGAPQASPQAAMNLPRRWPGYVDVVTERATEIAAGPRITDYLVAATTLPCEVSADEVRVVFAERPEASGVVLTDEDGRPRFSLQRDRFLLAVTGPYGHALHAGKPARHLADKPQIVTTSTTAMEALRLVMSSGRDRLYDDAVVVDEAARCLGVVRSVDLIRGLAELKADEAITLNPLTRLPGGDSLAREVERRIDRGDSFAVGWLDIDSFKSVNDVAGFAAGDDLIRNVGRSLTDAKATLEAVAVAHIGGDDFAVVVPPADLGTLAAMVLDPVRETHGMTISLSLATLECAPGSVTSYHEVSKRLAAVKQFAKRLPGTSWAAARFGTGRIEEVRSGAGTTDVGEVSGRSGPAEPGHNGDRSGAGPDSTRELRALARLQRSSQRFNDLLSLAPVGIGLVDDSGGLVDANPALCDLLGYELNELRGMTTDHLVHPQHRTAVAAPDDTGAGNQLMLIRSDGAPLWCELHSALSVRDDGAQFWLVVFQDITDRHRAAEELHHRATHDELTGLPNRVAVREQLDALLATQAVSVAAMVCDLDNFKRINDAFGHEVGDDVLTALAARLQKGVPEGCTVARITGDEFAVVCQDVSQVGGIDVLATEISHMFRTAVPVQGGELVRVSASIGAAVSDGSETAGADLLRSADAAKTEARRRGTGHVARAEPGVRNSACQQMHLEGALRTALVSDTLALRYQPIVTPEGAVTGAEALLRWPQPDGTVLSPGTFLPVAEQGGLLRDLDRWVLRTALAEAATWPRGPGGRAPEISVNVADLTSGDSGLIDEIAQVIEESGIACDRVVLEVVETALADLPQRPLAAMHELARRGVRFAVDDFGTGYSSLARLRDLPAQVVKVDRRFVRGVADDPTDRAVARAIVDMARAMGRRSVAEGVETIGQLHALRELGIDRCQGWLFSPPLPTSQFRGAIVQGTLQPVSSPALLS